MINIVHYLFQKQDHQLYNLMTPGMEISIMKKVWVILIKTKCTTQIKGFLQLQQFLQGLKWGKGYITPDIYGIFIFVIELPFKIFMSIINISALVVIHHKIFVNQLLLLMLSQVDCNFRLGQKVWTAHHLWLQKVEEVCHHFNTASHCILEIGTRVATARIHRYQM